MNCPHCAVPLAIAERSGVEIDYCPQCRGVWLDRGELDKILERAGNESRDVQRPMGDQPLREGEIPRAYQPPRMEDDRRRYDDDKRRYDDDRRRYDDDDDDDRYGKRRKKKSFLDDIFDF